MSSTYKKRFHQLRPGERFRMPRGDRPGGSVFVKLDDNRYEGEISKTVYDLRQMGGANRPADSFEVYVEEGARAQFPSEAAPASAAREQLPKLIECYRQISAREVPKGDFLIAFAEAFMLADAANRRLLASVALQLAEKYRLLDTMLPADEEVRA